MPQSLIDAAVLRLLACPACHAALTPLHPDAVLCAGCGRRYPLRDGLPVLLIPIASPVVGEDAPK